MAHLILVPMNLIHCLFLLPNGLISDIKDTFSASFHWKGDDWLRAAVVTRITTSLYFNDGRIMSWVQQHRDKTTAPIAWIAEKFGNPYKLLPREIKARTVFHY